MWNILISLEILKHVHVWCSVLKKKRPIFNNMSFVFTYLRLVEYRLVYQMAIITRIETIIKNTKK